MIIHYKGELGEFDYDDVQFSLTHDLHNTYLHFNNTCDVDDIQIPKGLKKGYRLFSGCDFTKSPVIPDGLIDASYMFYQCKNLKELSYLSDKIEICDEMCNGCVKLHKITNIPKAVTSCNFMFYCCSSLTEIPLFEINQECNYRYMFAHSDIRKVNPNFYHVLHKRITNVYTGCNNLVLPTRAKTETKYNIQRNYHATFGVTTQGISALGEIRNKTSLHSLKTLALVQQRNEKYPQSLEPYFYDKVLI